jgi:methionyl-tRNA synthetase
MEQLEQYGADAVRYYMIAGMPTFGDTAYKSEDLVNLVNSHLADGFGNLLSRVITLATKKEIVLSSDISQCSDAIKQQLTASQEKIA